MKSLAIGLMLASWCATQSPAPPAVAGAAPLLVGDQFGGAAEFGMRLSLFTLEAVLDLQETWNSYAAGWRTRHAPAPRPLVPRPDSIPPASTPALVCAGHTTTAPVRK